MCDNSTTCQLLIACCWRPASVFAVLALTHPDGWTFVIRAETDEAITTITALLPQIGETMENAKVRYARIAERYSVTDSNVGGGADIKTTVDGTITQQLLALKRANPVNGLTFPTLYP
jgi:hypothetical protein